MARGTRLRSGCGTVGQIDNLAHWAEPPYDTPGTSTHGTSTHETVALQGERAILYYLHYRQETLDASHFYGCLLHQNTPTIAPYTTHHCDLYALIGWPSLHIRCQTHWLQVICKSLLGIALPISAHWSP